ncbi:MAG: hypothetical protein U0136_06695 [Bdellovibrionota bacterium]
MASTKQAKWLTILLVVIVSSYGLILRLRIADKPHYRELRFRSNVIVLGNLEGIQNPTATYFSLRCEGLGSSCHPAVPLILHLGERAVPIADLTRSDMPTIGASDVTVAEDSAGNMRTFAASQNINGEVTFEFEGNRLNSFYASCDREDGCEFQISFGDRPAFAFPLSEAQLLALTPQPEQISDSSAK